MSAHLRLRATPPRLRWAPTRWRTAFASAATARGLDVEIVRNGSRGMVWLEPLVEVETADGPRRLWPGHGRPMSRRCSTPACSTAARIRWRLGLTEEIPFLKRQTRLTFARCGIDRSAVARRLRGAWRLQGLRTRARRSAPAAIVDEVTQSGLRGRGGAGFPTGIKWKTVARRRGDAEIHRLQRRRGRQRHLRRPHDDGRRSLRADRGHGDRRPRGRRDQGLRLHPLGISARRSRRWTRRSRWRAQAGVLGRERARLGARLRHRSARRRRRLCLRRGDLAARKPRRQARRGARQAAAAGASRACSASRPWSTT